MTLVRATKGKNIILSSDAQKVMELRGPYDVVNLGNLFGMSPDKAKASISKLCQSVVIHAETRKTYRGMLKVEGIPNLAPSTSHNKKKESKKSEDEEDDENDYDQEEDMDISQKGG